jgi:hypothetical protein
MGRTEFYGRSSALARRKTCKCHSKYAGAHKSFEKLVKNLPLRNRSQFHDDNITGNVLLGLFVRFAWERLNSIKYEVHQWDW